MVVGIDWKILMTIILGGVGSIWVAWSYLLNPEQISRVETFLGMGDANAAYQLNHSIIMIGSGKLTGKGIFSSETLSQLGYLPAKHTDFIFSVMIESMGFIGGFVLMILFLALLFRALRLATKSIDTLGTLIIVGVVFMMLAHIVENIGMTMGLMPITGIPLPFISYGGSSIWTNMIAFGLVLNIGMRREEINY